MNIGEQDRGKDRELQEFPEHPLNLSQNSRHSNGSFGGLFL
jgi:hypothetical protein